MLQGTMSDEPARWASLLLLLIAYQLHRELNRLGRLDVSPAGLLLVVYPLAGCFDDGRDVLITGAALHCLFEADLFRDGESSLRLLDSGLLLTSIETLGLLLLHRLILM